MEIRPVTRYPFKGVEYKSKKDLKEAIQNIIGVEVLDPINRVAPPQRHKDFVKILDLICEPKIRKVLNEVLNITIIDEDCDGEETELNILDFNIEDL